jgi:hypothetical protein
MKPYVEMYVLVTVRFRGGLAILQCGKCHAGKVQSVTKRGLFEIFINFLYGMQPFEWNAETF